MARKTAKTVITITVAFIITTKISELENQACECVTDTNEVGEAVTIKCNRCNRIDELKNACVCGKCDDCLNILLEHHKSQQCTCTYKTIQVEETIINEQGEKEVVLVYKDVVDVMCERCKTILSIEKQLDDRETLHKAYIDEVNFDKYEVVDGAIRSKVVEEGKKSEIDMLKLSNSEILSSTLNIDFRVMELEFIIEDNLPKPVGYKTNKTMKGSVNMTPYEMMYTLILADNYNREDFEYKSSVYVKRGRMTVEEREKLIAMMDAKELVPSK